MVQPRRFVLILALVALAIPAARAAQQEAPPVGAGHFVEAHRAGHDRDATYAFVWRGSRHEVSATGRLDIANGGQSIRRQVRFSTDREDFIERLYVAEHEADLVLVGELSNGLDGAGFAVRLGGTTHKTKWRAWISGFNVGDALLHERFAYVTAIGFVAKLDLATGRYAWRHDDLFPKNNAFNNFAKPALEGTRIVFVGTGQHGRDGNEIVVDDRSGKILEFRTSRPSNPV